jgi:POT family proton-dependent oligopeptide transporter
VDNENNTNYEKMLTYTAGYYQFAIYAIIAGVLIIVISHFIKKQKQEVK